MAAITSGQGVLLPEATRSKRKQRLITVAVNSRDRNLGSDYTSSNFRWSFQRPLKDVLSVELVNGCVPADLYTIAAGWNQFTFGEGTKRWQVTLTPGYYTPADLATELQLQLNNLTGKVNIYGVTYSTTTRRLTITAAGLNPTPFTFYFMTSPFTDAIDTHSGCITSINNPGRIMGFEWADYTSVRGSITPPNRVDTDMFVKKVYLHINSDNSVELNRLEMGGGRKSCFHIIYMDQTSGYYSLNMDTHTPVFYSAPAPISRMATLTISLRDEFGRVLDVGNHDFTLMFEITVLE
jgi:hypothetical protein